MNIWQFIVEKLENNLPCVLLSVLESSGSSPGRQGFKMVVAANSELYGSIGGGIMEHKFIEKAKAMLDQKEESIFYKKQIHRKDSPKNQSGMICSGEQSLTLFPLYPLPTSLQLLRNISTSTDGSIRLSPKGIETLADEVIPSFTYTTPDNWVYQESRLSHNRLYIIGGGHVSWALSKQMQLLDFHITVIDDREYLNTMIGNATAHEKIVVPYDQIAEYVPAGPNTFVVIVTFGYRSDKLIYEQLKENDYRYIGMMGSDAKIQNLLDAYRQEGMSEPDINILYAPIGEMIFSKTPAEIAVSIAAQIIKVKNRDLPGGRKKV